MGIVQTFTLITLAVAFGCHYLWETYPLLAFRKAGNYLLDWLAAHLGRARPVAEIAKEGWNCTTCVSVWVSGLLVGWIAWAPLSEPGWWLVGSLAVACAAWILLQVTQIIGVEWPYYESENEE